MGGTSSERDVSLDSGRNVLEALRRRGVQAEPVDGIPALVTALVEQRFDRVFNILHGQRGGGEDGVVQGLLEAFGVPYTGSDVLGSALSMDKIRTKQVWLALDLPTPRYVASRAERRRRGRGPTRSGLPVIVKPASEGSSVGVSRVMTEAELPEAVALARRYPGELLMEQLIEGDELTVAVLGDEALPSIRIVPAGAYYDYHAKYVAETTQYICPGLEGEAESRSRRARAARVPRRGLLRLGPGRRHARPDRRELPPRGEHVARHDQPLARAEGGARGRDRVRRARLAGAGDEPLRKPKIMKVSSLKSEA